MIKIELTAQEFKAIWELVYGLVEETKEISSPRPVIMTPEEIMAIQLRSVRNALWRGHKAVN